MRNTFLFTEAGRHRQQKETDISTKPALILDALLLLFLRDRGGTGSTWVRRHVNTTIPHRPVRDLCREPPALGAGWGREPAGLAVCVCEEGQNGRGDGQGKNWEAKTCSNYTKRENKQASCSVLQCVAQETWGLTREWEYDRGSERDREKERERETDREKTRARARKRVRERSKKARVRIKRENTSARARGKGGQKRQSARESRTHYNATHCNNNTLPRWRRKHRHNNTQEQQHTSTATNCTSNTLRHIATATHCTVGDTNTHTTTRCNSNTLQQQHTATATHCNSNTLSQQHTALATHCTVGDTNTIAPGLAMMATQISACSMINRPKWASPAHERVGE